MSGDLNLEHRYRRVLRLLPAYYRGKWEEDMVAAFLDSWLTGDREDDEAILEFCRPTWQETASVAGLAVRLHLGGAGAPRRYFAWEQAVRNAVLVVVLMHSARSVDAFVRLAWARRLFGIPGPPAYIAIAPPGGFWPSAFRVVDYVWIMIFVLLILGHNRTARVFAALAIVPDLVAVVQAQLNGTLQGAFGSWAFWVLLDLAPVLAMAAFYRDAPPAARKPWLLALPAGYLLVFAPVLAAEVTGNVVWLPDFAGLCCALVALACLAHTPKAWSRDSTGSGVWSLTLALLAAVTGLFRLASLGDYQHDPHLMTVSLAELLIVVVAAALVVPDATRAQTAVPAQSAYPRLGWKP
ncbi:MAG TPA: hypothetical protein VGG16_20940 [Streptosporangiaceae bacterium]